MQNKFCVRENNILVYFNFFIDEGGFIFNLNHINKSFNRLHVISIWMQLQDEFISKSKGNIEFVNIINNFNNFPTKINELKYKSKCYKYSIIIISNLKNRIGELKFFDLRNINTWREQIGIDNVQMLITETEAFFDMHTLKVDQFNFIKSVSRLRTILGLTSNGRTK